MQPDRPLFDAPAQGGWALDDGVAVVTGAASGIGRATATTLAAAGAPVILLDRDIAGAQLLAKALSADGRGVRACAARVDIAEESTVAAALAKMTDARPVAYLAHCAGVHQSAGTADLTAADWTRMLAVNLVGAFNVARAALPHLKQARNPAIVNVTSVESHRVVALVNPHPTPHYSAAKAGLDALTRSLAVEFAPHGIRVNAVAPGPVATALSSADHHGAEALHPAFAEHLLIKRYAQPEEIAQAIRFLLSTAATYITATTLFVDGGYTAL